MSHKNKHHGNRMGQDNQKFSNRNKQEGAEKPRMEEVTPEEVSPEELTPDEVSPEETETKDVCEDVEKKLAELEQQVEKEKKEYLFLMAEFDNFRKRTLKEKSDLIKNAGEGVLKGLLPIMDDFERGLKAAEASPEAESVREGVNLIYNKLKKYLEQNGVKEFDPNDDTFDSDKHEAITAVPVPDESKKGKIIDTVEKGYTLNDKVLRHAKVVVGQ